MEATMQNINVTLPVDDMKFFKELVKKMGWRIEKEKKQLLPTELGKVVNNLLVENFTDIINCEFRDNKAEYDGGAIDIYGGEFKIVKSIFETSNFSFISTNFFILSPKKTVGSNPNNS